MPAVQIRHDPAQRYRDVLERQARAAILGGNIPLSGKRITRMVNAYKRRIARAGVRVRKATPAPILPPVGDEKLYNNALQRRVLRPFMRSVRAGLSQATAAAEAIERLDGIPVRTTRRTGLIGAQVDAQAQRLQGYHRRKLISTFRQALAVDIRPVLREEPIRELMDDWRQDNIDLIETIPERYKAGLQAKMTEAFHEAPFDQQRLRRIVAQEGKVAGYNLRRITRDQTSKAIGQLTRARHQQLGIDEYTWRTSRDGRVRNSHSILEGTRQNYENPPAVGNPGEDIQCRCTASPFIDPDAPLEAPAETPGGQPVQIPPADPRLREIQALRGFVNDGVQRSAAEYRQIGGRVRGLMEPRLAQARAGIQKERVDLTLQQGGIVDEMFTAQRQIARTLVEAGESVPSLTKLGNVPYLNITGAQQARVYDKLSSALKDQFVAGLDRQFALYRDTQKITQTIDKLGEQLALVTRRVRVETLKEIRPMGGVKRIVDGSSAKSQVAVRAQDIADVYPTDWWNISKAAGRVRGTTGGRGFYRHVAQDAKGPVSQVHVDTLKKIGLAEQQSTTIHEFGHRMYYLRDQVRRTTQEFYEARTAGESLRKLNEFNPAYDSWEVTKIDKFKNPYMGKSYEGEARELFSMGMESLVGERAAIQHYDQELGDTILGLLAAV